MTPSAITPRPYSVRTLADRWSCSEDHIRLMIRDRKLRAFKLGGKLTRITAEEVERWESQEVPGDAATPADGASGATGEDSAPSGMTKRDEDIAARSARLIAQMPIAPLPSSTAPNVLPFKAER